MTKVQWERTKTRRHRLAGRITALGAAVGLTIASGIYGTQAHAATGPDLGVSAIGTVEPATVGTPARFTAVVRNGGDTATPAGVTVGVLFLVAGHDEFTTFAGAYRGPLAAGASVQVTASGGIATTPDGAWTPTAAGIHSVTAVVDDVNRIAESNETNNVATWSFPVGTGAGEYSPYRATNGFYVDPDSEGARWYRGHTADIRAAAIKAAIVDRAAARWVGPGDITGWVNSYVSGATAAGQLPVLVGYAIPNRDCGDQSAGGERDTAAYLAWAQRLAYAIGDRPAVVVLEPDAVMLCWNDDKRRQLRGAIDALTLSAPKTWVYLDGGDGRWNPPSDIAPRIQQVGLQGVRGISMNVSNYNTEATVRTFMADFNSRIGRNVPFIYDTSRNGNGPDAAGNWCNPAGRRIGAPSAVRNVNGLDAVLWIKYPGVSDGRCGAYPAVPSGVFDPQIAVNLINGS